MNIIHVYLIVCSFPPHFPFYHFTILYKKIGLGLSSREIHALQAHPCFVNSTLGTSESTAIYLTSLGPHLTWRWNIVITAEMCSLLHHSSSCSCQLAPVLARVLGRGNMGGSDLTGTIWICMPLWCHQLHYASCNSITCFLIWFHSSELLVFSRQLLKSKPNCALESQSMLCNMEENWLY